MKKIIIIILSIFLITKNAFAISISSEMNGDNTTGTIDLFGYLF